MEINQIIYTVQGEGKNIGVPTLLIRVQGCNLQCPWCDTKHSRNKDNESNNELYFYKTINYYLTRFPINNIMITGGEPFLQIEDIISKLDRNLMLRDANIEIETNGTLISDRNLDNTIITRKNIMLNISPKLDINCYPNIIKKKTTIDEVFEIYLQSIYKLYKYNMNFNIKFIYTPEDENVILRFIKINKLKENNVPIYVMTKTENNEMNWNNCLKTVEFCKEYDLIYSPRIHLPLFKKDLQEKT